MLQLYRASILHFLSDPTKSSSTDASYEYWEDGLLVVKDGKVKAIGEYSEWIKEHEESKVIDYTGKLILPGFVDTHIHFPQTEMIASYGAELLDWLNTYTFPTEKQFGNKEYAQKIAKFFLRQLLLQGTTTALVFGSVHKTSVEAFFEEAQKQSLRMIAGKVMMDRNAPAYLLDTPESSYQDSKALIEKWHGKDRLLYAVTPRFAPTSSKEQLAKAKQLLEEFPEVYLHTHLSENREELAWVNDLFPEADNYLDVYDKAGLVRPKSVFAHSIYLSDSEWNTLHTHDCSVAFCPTSNLFLGSGLFNIQAAQKHRVRVGMGTDVGAGTSFSILETLQEAYKVNQLRKAFPEEEYAHEPLSALKAFYLATLGGAEALHLEAFIGNFEKGKEADFVVLDLASSELLEFRLAQCKSLEERLFVIQMLANDRTVAQTYILGQPAL